MTLKEIEEEASHYKRTIITSTREIEIKKNIIKLLEIYIQNNVKLDIYEIDFKKIMNIYHSIYHKYNYQFFKEIAKQSKHEINFFKVLNNE